MTGPRTLFRHIFKDRAVDIDQMWICDQANKSFPHLFYSLGTWSYANALECDNTDGSATRTHCNIPDEKTTSFSGEYSTPYWNTKSPEIISPGPVPANASDSPPWNETPCIGLSFSYPNWDVDKLTYSGEHVEFSLRNHANNQSSRCSFERRDSSSEHWVTCDNSTQALFNEQTQQLHVNQTWQCSIKNYAEPITFNAFGNATLKLNCQQAGSCSAAHTVIKGSLTEPIEFTPNVAPKGVNYPGCLQNSESPSWEVTYLLWRETFRNNRNVGIVDAVFKNNANGVTISCSGQGEELNIIGSEDHERWWGCDLIEREAFPKYQIASKIKLNPVTRQFAISQPWWCNADRDASPAKFIGEGRIDVPFSCAWTNSSSSTSPGSDTTCPISNSTGWNCTQTCKIGSTLHMPGFITNKTNLSSTEFVEPAPSGYSCTIGSVLSPKWRIPWSTLTPFWGSPLFPNTTETLVSFNLQNMVLGGFAAAAHSDVGMTPLLSGSDPDRWFDCVDNVGKSVPTVLDCQWQFDLKTGYFAIRQSWYCDDKDPEHPIVFKGEGSRFFSYTCYVDRQSRDITCQTPDSTPILPTTYEWDTSGDLDGLMK
ncbi:hypothetical protein JX266_003913 [Neoarthrinium moseri]|nr:hypothetical protein JX266_003913 [Neoarthrinium moseri]